MDVYPIGKERLYQILAIVVVLVLAGAGYASWRYKNDQLLQAQTDLRDSQVAYEVIKGKLVQADNTKVVDVEELKRNLSENFRHQLETQKQQILAQVHEEIKVIGKGGGTGTGTSTGTSTAITHFTYSDELMRVIDVNAADPKKPAFNYELNPFTIVLESTLNFGKTDGVARFWVEPTATGLPKQLTVTVPALTLKPSAEFNRWVTELSGNKTTVPVPSKYMVNALVGKDFTPGLTIPRTVYGVQLQYNFSNGWGGGAGVIGNTTFVSGGYSWGKH